MFFLILILHKAGHGDSETLPLVTATVAALGVPSHGLYSDLSNIQANLVLVIFLALLIALIGPSSGHLLASSNFNFNTFISIYDIIHPVYKSASSLC